MQRRRDGAVHPPKLTPVGLPALDPVEPTALRAHTRVELVELRDADLSNRDLGGLDLLESRLTAVTMHGGRLRSATIVDVILERLDAATLSAASLSLRDVEVSDSRIASAELFDGSWQSVHFTGCKLGFLNLRGAQLRDIRFTDCTIDELDLGGASVVRMAFDATPIRTLDVTGATLTDVDLRGAEIDEITGVAGLRGATLSTDQLRDLAPALAAEFGIRSAD